MAEVAAMPKYEVYKDSGVEWLGEIPKHWEVSPLCSKATLKSITDKVDEELLSVYLDKGVIRFRDVESKRTNVTSLDLSKYQLVEVGDFVLNNQQAWRGSVGVSDYQGIVSPAYLILKLSEEINPKFGNYFFRDGNMVSQYLICSKGVGTIQRNLYWPQLKRVSIALPPVVEQIAIANFLDKKTAQIDEAIIIKEKQIELLKERKQIIIQQAVTQGVSYEGQPDVAMKDSGVDWIGEIPEHWEVIPGFTAFKENKSSNRGMLESRVLSLSYGKIVVKPKEKLTGLVPESFETYQLVKAGDIIIRGMDLQNDKTSLRTAIARDSGIISSAYLNLNILNNHVPEFLYYFLHTMDTTKAIYKLGTGLRQNLSFNDFKHLPVLKCPKNEQENIIDEIKSISRKVSEVITLQKNYINKLKEYKTTLINSAVTGKIKVS